MDKKLIYRMNWILDEGGEQISSVINDLTNHQGMKL